jgi:hypothetical protein
LFQDCLAVYGDKVDGSLASSCKVGDAAEALVGRSSARLQMGDIRIVTIDQPHGFKRRLFRAVGLASRRDRCAESVTL